MSKIIYIVSRRSDCFSQDKLNRIDKRINPDNISPNPMKLLSGMNSICAIINPVSTIQVKDNSVCLGYSPNDNWDEMNVRADEIEGSFALYRNSDVSFQIATDCLATRTIWYYYDDELFIASSSQRAIIIYLGSFVFNEQVIPWMLSSGTPGPGLSYDKRIKMVEPNSLVTLDKIKWTVTIEENTIRIDNKYTDRAVAKRAIHEALQSTFNRFHFDFNKVGLPLSGGYDSRAILLYLLGRKEIRTITWGMAGSREIPKNDAYIAKQLADSFGLKNYFYESYNENLPLKTVLSRFIQCSEGRIDHIRGYLDGMEMWKAFFERGFECLLRGDEVFGDPPRSELAERGSKALIVLDDYTNTKSLIEKVHFLHQEIPMRYRPDYYQDRNTWVGRLVMGYEMKITYSALNEIKNSYVEIVTPLLSSSIVKTIAANYNIDITKNKNVYKELIGEQCDIPFAYARVGANKPLNEFLDNNADLIRLFIESFSDSTSKNFLPEELLNYGCEVLVSKLKFLSLDEFAKWVCYRAVPKFFTGNTKKLEMDWRVFALRLYLLLETCKMMSEDSN